MGVEARVIACARMRAALFDLWAAVFAVAVAAVSAASFAAMSPLSVSAQSAGTLEHADPAYEDLARLEAYGLIPSGLSRQRPLSRGRVAGLVAEAHRAHESAREDSSTDSLLPAAALADVEALIRRLEGRFGEGRVDVASVALTLEAGGGRSPGRVFAPNDLGGLDAVVNPLWANRGGRAYGDERSLAASVRGSVPLGASVAVGLGRRASYGAYSGVAPSRRGSTQESAFVRGVLGSVALQVGRDGAWLGRNTRGDLLLSGDGPPLDLVRLSTDRPISLPLLGDLEFSVMAADLGPGQNFPHAKLVVASFDVRPTQSVEIGLTLVNKQGGDGAPAASAGERIKDLSFFWDLFRRGRDYTFSEKIVGLDARVLVPSARGLSVAAGVVLTDLDPTRLGDVLEADAVYRVSLSAPRLGASQRHRLDFAGEWSGPLPYRHHQFVSGFSVAGFSQGSDLGPDGRRIAIGYRFDAPVKAFEAGLRGVYETRGNDRYGVRYTPNKDVFLESTVPREQRTRVEAHGRRWLRAGRAGVDLSAGLERARGFAHEAGADRTNMAVLVRTWVTF